MQDTLGSSAFSTFFFSQAGFTHFIQVATRLGVASSTDLAVFCVVWLTPGWRAEPRKPGHLGGVWG